MAKLISIYKVDKKGNPLSGSNIKRLLGNSYLPKGLKPFYKIGGQKWLVIPKVCCTEPEEISCTCDFRYFVQIDSNNIPVDRTLMRRKKKPEGTSGLRFIELPSKLCCLSENEG